MPSAKDQVDYYDTIGVSRSATQDEIQRAYRKLARAWHPDVNHAPEAEDRFKQISEAYDVLSDPDRRARYDAFGPDFRQVPDGTDPAAWARAQRSARNQPRSGGARATNQGRAGDADGDAGQHTALRVAHHASQRTGLLRLGPTRQTERQPKNKNNYPTSEKVHTEVSPGTAIRSGPTKRRPPKLESWDFTTKTTVAGPGPTGWIRH